MSFLKSHINQIKNDCNKSDSRGNSYKSFFIWDFFDLFLMIVDKIDDLNDRIRKLESKG